MRIYRVDAEELVSCMKLVNEWKFTLLVVVLLEVDPELRHLDLDAITLDMVVQECERELSESEISIHAALVDNCHGGGALGRLLRLFLFFSSLQAGSGPALRSCGLLLYFYCGVLGTGRVSVVSSSLLVVILTFIIVVDVLQLLD